MPKVIHFEIPADNPDELIEFFSETFGWQFSQYGDMPYWLINTGSEDGPGINGAIMKRANERHKVQNTIRVDDIDETRRKIEANGGKINSEIMEIPGIGKMFYFSDPDNNIHAAMQESTR